jgi:hypothetical protein
MMKENMKTDKQTSEKRESSTAPLHHRPLVSHPALFGMGSVGLAARSSLKTHTHRTRWHLEKSSTPRSELGFRVSNT